MAGFPFDSAGSSFPNIPSGERTSHALLVLGDSHEARAVARTLTGAGLAVYHALTSAEADARLASDTPSVCLVDIDTDHFEALEFCRRVKRDSATRLVPIVLLTAEGQRAHRLAGIEAGAEATLAKPFDAEELLFRVRAFSRVRQYTSDLDSAAAIVMTVTAMIEARESSPGHCYRMANYAIALGRTLQLGDAQLTALHRGAFLHDIGMLAIPDHILAKGGRLEPEEYEIVKSHPIVGDALCANLRTLHHVRPIVRHHHERLDGSGYPDGLRGDAVPLLAQIVSIVDVFEAITTGRRYLPARSPQEALGVLQHEVRVGWRRGDLVDAFIGLVANGALERFRGATRDPAAEELAAFATDLQRASLWPSL